MYEFAMISFPFVPNGTLIDCLILIPTNTCPDGKLVGYFQLSLWEALPCVWIVRANNLGGAYLAFLNFLHTINDFLLP